MASSGAGVVATSFVACGVGEGKGVDWGSGEGVADGAVAGFGGI